MAFPSYDGINKIPITLNDYDFPAPVSAPQPAPVAVATPAPVKIMKPNLRAGRAHVTNFDYMGLGQTKKGKNAAHLSIVQKSKVLAPARNVSEITPQVTVQHPTKVSIKTVAAPAVPT